MEMDSRKKGKGRVVVTKYLDGKMSRISLGWTQIKGIIGLNLGCKRADQSEWKMKRAIILSNGTQVLGAVTLGENGNVMQDKQTIDKREAN